MRVFAALEGSPPIPVSPGVAWLASHLDAPWFNQRGDAMNPDLMQPYLEWVLLKQWKDKIVEYQDMVEYVGFNVDDDKECFERFVILQDPPMSPYDHAKLVVSQRWMDVLTNKQSVASLENLATLYIVVRHLKESNAFAYVSRTGFDSMIKSIKSATNEDADPETYRFVDFHGIDVVKLVKEMFDCILVPDFFKALRRLPNEHGDYLTIDARKDNSRICAFQDPANPSLYYACMGWVHAMVLKRVFRHSMLGKMFALETDHIFRVGSINFYGDQHQVTIGGAVVESGEITHDDIYLSIMQAVYKRHLNDIIVGFQWKLRDIPTVSDTALFWYHNHFPIDTLDRRITTITS